jgi:competence protein ComGC
MFRVFGLVAMLIALLIVALLYKHQISAQGVGKHAPAASEVSGLASVAEVNTPAQGQQLQQQIQDDLNKAAQEQRRQLDQSVERSTQ